MQNIFTNKIRYIKSLIYTKILKYNSYIGYHARIQHNEYIVVINVLLKMIATTIQYYNFNKIENNIFCGITLS